MENVSQINSGATVTVEDVAAACTSMGVGAGETNSSKVRQNLGRGSLSTIQKHLQTLRDDAARAQEPSAQIGVPSVPTDLQASFGSIWGAAYTSASHQFGNQLLAAWTERDSLRESMIILEADVNSLAGQLDEQEAANEQAIADRETAISQRNEAIQSLLVNTQAAEERAAQLVLLAKEDAQKAEKKLQDATHQAELVELGKTIERQSLQSTIDRLTDQIGELKGLLSLQARPLQVVPVGIE